MLPYSFTIPAAICLLGALHLFLAYFKWFEIRQKLRFHVKYFLYHAAIAFLFGCTTIPCLLNPGSAENMKYAKKLYHISKVASWFGLTIVTEGQENMRAVKAPVVIICNHQTSLDVLIAIKELPVPTAILAKKSVFYAPLFGLAAWLCGTVFIDRTSYTSVQTLQNVVGKLKRNKTSLWVFPEGTRHQNDSMLPFKKGGFHLAVQAQIPIVPIVVGNCRNVIDVKNEIFDSGTLRVRILPPIQTFGLSKANVDQLKDECWEKMNVAYDQMTQDFKEEYKDMIPL
eukprot:Seg4076.2 transcript_id=Seg4076.2/GoldUCD/mRNA.D3Y31 product="1-acyl-sn-glycerol-3-phosphate acyltransferase alpha" protein_id=Seg4076.2/GoldUCD/D3Y31